MKTSILQKNKIISTIQKKSSSVIVFIILLVLWIIGSHHYSSIILPSPKETLISVWDIIKSGTLMDEILKTLGRLFLGILYSVILGTIIGFAMGISKIMKKYLESFIYILQSIPPILFMTLAMIWFGLDGQAVIFIIFISGFPTLAINIMEGFENIDKNLIQMARLFKFSKAKIIFTIILPSLRSYFKSGFLIVTSLGWKLCIMGEVFSSANGLGARMTDARLNLQTDRVFAWGVIIIVLCFISQKLVSFLFSISKRGRLEKNA